MDFFRTRDYEQVHSILTAPAVYPRIGDDYSPPDPAAFVVNQHPDIWYIVVRNRDSHKVGLFLCFPQNRICWELHVVIIPGTPTEEKWAAAHEFVPWLGRETECRRLTASVPSCNRPAIVYGTHGLGMRIVGRQQKAFMKHGELRDLILLGRSVNGSQ